MGDALSRDGPVETGEPLAGKQRQETNRCTEENNRHAGMWAKFSVDEFRFTDVDGPVRRELVAL